MAKIEPKSFVMKELCTINKTLHRFVNLLFHQRNQLK